MSDRDCRYSKRELLGNLHVGCVMSVTDPGLAARSNRWDVLRAFLAVGKPGRNGLSRKKMAFRSCWACPEKQTRVGSTCSPLLY
ncbi:MAG: hypothetical protein WBA18_19915 [Terracidiphilus sp.]